MTTIAFKDAPWWTANAYLIGQERMPLLVIDNFHPDPNTLTKDAKNKSFTQNAPYFPGIRAPISETYFHPIVDGLSDVLKTVFLYQRGIRVNESHYSLTTTAKKDLNMVQRLPHVDGGHDMKIALLHYLCGPEHGGTAFYKQCRTNFETVSVKRFKIYESAVELDHENLGPPKAEYFNKSNARFEQIHKIEAKFNRAILYFGVNLHSVIIGSKPLTNTPETGRLTINTFLSPL